ncbi:hypothetical protein Ancab_035759 [Ancistrocladus abbreviatus]
MATLLPTLFCAFIFFVAVFKIFFLTSKARKTKQNLPPSPPMLPLIGNLHQLGRMPHLSLSQLAEKLGPIIFLQLGEIPTVVVSSATMAKELMKTHDAVFASRPQLFSAKWLLYDCTDIGFSPYGTHWRHIRKICTHEMLSTKRVQSYSPVREEEVSCLVHRILKCCDSKINLTRMLGLYVNDVLCRVVLGRSFPEKGEYDGNSFLKMLEEHQELLGGVTIGDFFPSKEFIHTITGHKSRVKKVFQHIDNFLNKVIEEHLDPQREKTREKDLLDILLDIQRDESGEKPLTLYSVKAILMDMFAAGIDTTYKTLDWAMTELIMNPRVMKQAQAEVRSVVGEKEVVSEANLPQLLYLKAIVKEILRLHPPVPMLLPRESIK